MSIGDVKIFPIVNGKAIKANGSFVYNEVLRISCSVVEGKTGLFVSLPREKYKDKTTGEEKWADKVYCMSDELKKQINEAVIAAYNKQTGVTMNQGTSGEPATQVAPKRSKVPF